MGGLAPSRSPAGAAFRVRPGHSHRRWTPAPERHGSQAYNQQRGFVQTMIPLAVCIGFALQTVRDALPRWVPWQLAALVPMIIMVSTSSLGSTLIQGSGSADLQARGDDVDQFVLEPAELAAARWMQVVPAGAPVYTDAYGGLRLAASGRAQIPRSLSGHRSRDGRSARVDLCTRR